MKLHKRKPMFPAFLWLGLYLLLSTVIGNIAQTDQEVYLFGAVPQLVLALACYFYLLQTDLSTQIGLTSPTIEKMQPCYTIFHLFWCLFFHSYMVSVLICLH